MHARLRGSRPVALLLALAALLALAGPAGAQQGPPTTVVVAPGVPQPTVVGQPAGEGATTTTQAPAQTDPSVVVALTAGQAGVIRAGALVPISVAVSSEVLLTGELRIRADWSREVVSVPIELAAGTSKELRIAVPGPTFDPGSLSIDAGVRRDGKLVASARAPAVLSVDQQVVGVLPGLVAPEERVVLDDSGVVLRAIAVDGEDLGQPGALGPLALLAGRADDLADLDDDTLDAVLRWIATGGTLLLDDAAVAAVPGLPAEWQPAEQAWRTAGLGEVRRTGGALAAGRWASVETAAATSSIDVGNRFAGESLEQSIARDAGLRLPDIAPLLLGVAAYIVVVGPVVAIALRRRRQWTWVAVPGIAIVATLVVLVAGQGTRVDQLTVFAAVAETGPHSPEVYAMVGETSPGGGTVRVSGPAGVTVSGAFGGFGFDPFGEVATVTSDGTTSTLSRRLPTGGLGTARLLGAIDGVSGRLLVRGTEGEEVEIENQTPYTLEEVGVFSGTSYATAGRIGPGETTTVVVDQEVRDRFAPRELGVWPDAVGWNGPPSDGIVAYPAYLESNQRWMLANDRPGLVTAVGWTRDAQLDVEGGTDRGRTAIVGRGTLAAVDGSIRSDVLLLDLSEQRADDRLGGIVPITMRLRMAPGGTAAGRTLSLAGGVAEVEVRAADEWISIFTDESPDFGKSDGPEVEVALPADLAGETLVIRVHYPIDAIYSGAVVGNAVVA